MNSHTGQVIATAAEVYQELFVPALFSEWAPRVADALRLRSGARVLDVACGTGVLAREIHSRLGGAGVVGLDKNRGMLAVAGRQNPDITWQLGEAEQLPFENASFDAVGCQFGVMFFENRSGAVAEMVRVLRPAGSLVCTAWARLEDTPAYARLVALLCNLFGEAVAAALKVPFSLGDRAALSRVFHDAGIERFELSTRVGMARFPSIREWVRTEIRGWTLAEAIDEDGLTRLEREAETELQAFTRGGRVEFDSPAHLVVVRKEQ